MKRRNRKFFNYKNNTPWTENLQLVMQLGLTMVGCIIFCFFIGYFIDKWIGVKGPFIVIFTILGIIGGGVVVYRQIMEVFDDTRDDNGIDGNP